jgi:hypothetical protein
VSQEIAEHSKFRVTDISAAGQGYRDHSIEIRRQIIDFTFWLWQFSLRQWFSYNPVRAGFLFLKGSQLPSLVDHIEALAGPLARRRCPCAGKEEFRWGFGGIAARNRRGYTAASLRGKTP